MMRVTGVLALLASVSLVALLLRGLRHFDLQVLRTPTGYEALMPGPGPFRGVPDSPTSSNRQLFSWDTEDKLWTMHQPSVLDARLRDISNNGDVCHREFTLPLIDWTFASTTFIPLEDTARTRPRTHSWAIIKSLGAVAAAPLLLWGVAAVLVALATSRQKGEAVLPS
jgi:hypothetical protein